MIHNSISGNISQRTENKVPRRYLYIPMFIAGLFIITRTWKQPKCIPTNKQRSKIRYLHTIEYYSAFKKEGHFGLCYNMDEPWRHHMNEITQSKKNATWFYAYDVLKIIRMIKTNRMVPRRREMESYGLMGLEFQFSKMRWVTEKDGGGVSCKEIVNVFNIIEVYP